MKINEIIREDQGTIKALEPGKSVTVAMPDGTLITKDLTKDPGAIGKDAQGNPVFNMANQPQTGTAGQPQEKPLTPGTQIGINTDAQSSSSETMGEHPAGISAFETADEEEEEKNDTFSSGKNKDIGGDPTDSFIRQVTDKSFERYARGKPTMHQEKKLAENDELQRWLTIARLR